MNYSVMNSGMIENSFGEGNVASLSASIGIITDSPELTENITHFSVTTALTYCKTKILRPYLRFLSITGLRSFNTDLGEGFTAKGCLCCLYRSQLLALILVGYFLQYMSCFRRDRGFSYIVLESSKLRSSAYHLYESVCDESTTFSYLIPHILHFMGYMHAFHVFRSSNDDQLPSLMESVFLTLTNLSDGFQSQKKLVRTLWIFVAVSLVWMLLSLITVTTMLAIGKIEFKWIHEKHTFLILVLKIILVASTLCHDVVQATVISNYCLQAQLLTSYVQFLKAKLLQHSVLALEWMRDIEEFKKLLHFLNLKLAPSVCIFSLLNISRAITGILWMLNLDNVDKNNWYSIGVPVINIFLWIVLSLGPFIQASRLTNSCENIRGVGHEMRVQPFPTHSIHNDRTKHLDSLLLYASSLKLKARLFGLPIKPTYIYFLISLASFIIIILGQLHYLK